MEIVFSERARKEWSRLERTLQNQLRKKLHFYLQSGQPLKFAEKIQDSSLGQYHFRIGDYHARRRAAMKTVQILQALLTPVIAIVAICIAYQQWKTNKHRLTLERYDRRLRVYQEVVKTLRLIGRDLDPKLDDLLEFWVATAEADFLFGPEIRQYVDEIFSRGHKLSLANKQYRAERKPMEYDHKGVEEEMSSQEEWLTEQLLIVEGRMKVTEKFKPYLDISK